MMLLRWLIAAGAFSFLFWYIPVAFADGWITGTEMLVMAINALVLLLTLARAAEALLHLDTLDERFTE